MGNPRTRNLHPRFTRTHSPPTVFTPWGRELELSEKKMKIQKKSQRYLTLTRYKIQEDTRYKIQEIQDTRYKIQDTRNFILRRFVYINISSIELVSDYK